jgi:hypothetical protein
LCACCASKPGVRRPELIAACLDDVRALTDAAALLDDLTLLAIRRIS